MAENYFQVDKISVKYGDIQVLWDISFEAAKGEIIALVGSNGAGKSTAVKAASGLVKPAEERLHLMDRMLPEEIAVVLLIMALFSVRKEGSFSHR